MGRRTYEYMRESLTEDGLEDTRYINAYEITQGYGGPEEGGWWYTIGEPLASIPVRTVAEALSAIDMLEGQFGEQYADMREYTSAAGDGADLSICRDTEVAAPFPQGRPHYE